jgi:hypothetical protein
VNATDDDGSLFTKKGIVGVEFFIDGVSMYTADNAPFVYSWNTAYETLGNRNISVIATDEGDNDTKTEVMIILNDRPTCTFTTPLNNGSVFKNGDITITTDVANYIGSISEVRFYCDDGLISTVFGSPYTAYWDASSYSLGNHTLKVEAEDSYGATGESSITVELKTSKVVGTWLSDNNYTGYDPLISKNTSFLRKLYIYSDYTYVDSLRGEPEDQGYYNVYEMESGTWRTDDTESSITFTPSVAKHMKIDDPTTLEDYSLGEHQATIDLSESDTKWAWKDTDLEPDVDYYMTKSTSK